MREIALNKGFTALVDEEDYEVLSTYKWYVQSNYRVLYVVSRFRARESGIDTTLRMHRVVLGAKAGQVVDHINSNGLDNQKSNLRFVTSEENGYNRRANLNTRSGYKGVSWNNGRWNAQLRYKDKRLHLGFFDDPLEAAEAYDRAAFIYYGPFARTNIITDVSQYLAIEGV